MIELALLGLLSDQALHGYQLKKRLREVLGPLARASYGSLYPALARLERAGAVTAPAPPPGPPAMPMTGSLGAEAAAFRSTAPGPDQGSRHRKVYAITPAGRERLQQLLADPGQDDRTFALKMAFLRHLATEARATLLERRRSALLERLTEARRTLAAGHGPDDSYARSLLEHDVETTEHDIAWLDRLIRAERTTGPSTTRPTGGPRS
jgi:DNA-binding PadR family transcriptional regulator